MSSIILQSLIFITFTVSKKIATLKFSTFPNIQPASQPNRDHYIFFHLSKKKCMTGPYYYTILLTFLQNNFLVRWYMHVYGARYIGTATISLLLHVTPFFPEKKQEFYVLFYTWYSSITHRLTRPEQQDVLLGKWFSAF